MQKKMMMNRFQGFTNLMPIMLFVFFVFLASHTTVATHQTIGKSLAELLMSDDLIAAAGYGDEKLSTVVVGGSVLCDTCSDGTSHPVPGASMAVSCQTSGKASKSNWVRGITDEYGDFIIDLPSHLHAVPDLDKRCIVRILELPKSSPCHRSSTGKHNKIKFSSAENGLRTYTAHKIRLTPKHSRARMYKHRSNRKTMVRI